MDRLRAYYLLTKPGIIRGNLIHIAVGLFIGLHSNKPSIAIIGVLIGTALVIASACVVNNFTDRDTDARMKRTKVRASVQGTISLRAGVTFALLLGLAGFGILALTTNLLVIAIGVLAYVSYTWWYAIAKRRSVHGTVVGALPGALPVLAGYVAVTNHIDLIGLLLFMLVFVWQMPHFYAISVFRKSDYYGAGLPVAAVVWSYKKVRRTMLAWMYVYFLILIQLTYIGGLSPVAGILVGMTASYWLATIYRINEDHIRWGRRVFGVSLLVTLALFAATAVDYFVLQSIYSTM